MSGREWAVRAACRDEDPELFYADRGQNDLVARALAVCRRCPVTTECREWTLEAESRKGQSPHGTAGGLTARQRRPLVEKIRASRLVDRIGAAR